MKTNNKTEEYKKDNVRICFRCKKEMYESEMTQRPFVMGSGTYPAVCPHCKAEASPFDRSHKFTDKFRMIKAQKIMETMQ